MVPLSVSWFIWSTWTALRKFLQGWVIAQALLSSPPMPSTYRSIKWREECRQKRLNLFSNTRLFSPSFYGYCLNYQFFDYIIWYVYYLQQRWKWTAPMRAGRSWRGPHMTLNMSHGNWTGLSRSWTEDFILFWSSLKTNIKGLIRKHRLKNTCSNLWIWTGIGQKMYLQRHL